MDLSLPPRFPPYEGVRVHDRASVSLTFPLLPGSRFPLRHQAIVL